MHNLVFETKKMHFWCALQNKEKNTTNKYANNKFYLFDQLQCCFTSIIKILIQGRMHGENCQKYPSKSDHFCKVLNNNHKMSALQVTFNSFSTLWCNKHDNNNDFKNICLP